MSENTPTANVTPEPFATPELFRECLTLDELSDFFESAETYETLFSHRAPEDRPKALGDVIGLSDTESFLAECVYLNHWNEALDGEPDENGINIDYYPTSADGHTINGAEIDISYKGEANVAFVYELNPDHGDSYDLKIIDDENNCVYWRQAGQNPRTEWLTNCMANDPEYVDAAGNIAFSGEPVNL